MDEKKDEITLKDLESVYQFINFEEINNDINTEISIFRDNIQKLYVHEKKIRATITVRSTANIRD